MTTATEPPTVTRATGLEFVWLEITGKCPAHLLCSATLQPAVAARVKAEFADVLHTYSGAVAVLTAASKYLHHVESGEFPDVAIPIRRCAEAAIRDRLTD